MNRRPSILVIFLSVFIDLIGFGIVLPLLPGYAEDYGAKGVLIGTIIASFSAMQFLFAPAWGRLSDRIGRRPVMLISNLGAAGSYALFALASTLHGNAALWGILVSRVFAGIAGANLSVASAYIADISPPEKRSAGMGIIGMAFGIGFIVGPALGAFSMSMLGPTGPGWVACGFCAANFVLGWFILGESRQPGSAPATARPKFAQWSHTLRQPDLGLLIGVFFLATFCFTVFESTFALLLRRVFHYGSGDHRVGYLFTYAGLITALLQGGVIGRLVKRFGEPVLIFSSLLIFAAGLAMLPFQTHLAGLLVALAVLAIGSGINRPPVFGLISLKSSSHEQGANLGVAQSFGSLARILGPMFATTAFQIKPALPYLVCSGIALGTSLLAWHFVSRNSAAATVGTPRSADL
jgi:MFS family permease